MGRFDKKKTNKKHTKNQGRGVGGWFPGLDLVLLKRSADLSDIGKIIDMGYDKGRLLFDRDGKKTYCLQVD